MEVSCQLYAPSTYHQGMRPRYPSNWMLSGPFGLTEKSQYIWTLVGIRTLIVVSSSP